MLTLTEYNKEIFNQSEQLCNQLLNDPALSIDELSVDAKEIIFADFSWSEWAPDNLGSFYKEPSQEMIYGCRVYSKYLEYAVDSSYLQSFNSVLIETLRREILIQATYKYCVVVNKIFPERTGKLIYDAEFYFSDFKRVCEDYFSNM